MVATSDKKVKRKARNDALQQKESSPKNVEAFPFDEEEPAITRTTTTTTQKHHDPPTSTISPTSTATQTLFDGPSSPSSPSCLANLAAKKVMEKLQADSALFDKVRDIPRFASSEVDVFQNNVLGEGGFGVVRAGQLKSLSSSSNNHNNNNNNNNKIVKVAIKHVRPVLATKSPTVFANGAADLVTEGEILGRLSHPNIIRLHGVSNNMDFTYPADADNSYFIVLEPLNHTLGTKLAEWYQLTTSTGKQLPIKERLKLLKERLQVALSIAKAIQYLHSKNILYRDLKIENVGFTADGTVKLFDFGLAKEIKKSQQQQQQEKYKLTGNTGSRRYMAPEVAKGWAYNHLVDVYSFSILLWEICACQRAFPQYTTPEEFTQRVHQGEERPPLHDYDWWPVELQWILKKSWSFFANSRPNMNVVVETLEEVLEDIDQEVGGGGRQQQSNTSSSLRRFIRNTTETFRLSKNGNTEGQQQQRPPKPFSSSSSTTSRNQLPPPPPLLLTRPHKHHRRGGSGGAGLFGFGLFAKHHHEQQQQQRKKQQEKPEPKKEDYQELLSDNESLSSSSSSSIEYES